MLEEMISVQGSSGSEYYGYSIRLEKTADDKYTPKTIYTRGESMSNMVLLVVDVQTEMIEEQPYNNRQVIDNIRTLINAARENKKK